MTPVVGLGQRAGLWQRLVAAHANGVGLLPAASCAQGLLPQSTKP